MTEVAGEDDRSDPYRQAGIFRQAALAAHLTQASRDGALLAVVQPRYRATAAVFLATLLLAAGLAAALPIRRSVRVNARLVCASDLVVAAPAARAVSAVGTAIASAPPCSLLAVARASELAGAIPARGAPVILQLGAGPPLRAAVADPGGRLLESPPCAGDAGARPTVATTARPVVVIDLESDGRNAAAGGALAPGLAGRAEVVVGRERLLTALLGQARTWFRGGASR